MDDQLNRALVAMRIAKEYGYCPDSSELDEVRELFPEATEEILNTYLGLRADEIANLIKRITKKN
jgi:hypothetical protein